LKKIIVTSLVVSTLLLAAQTPTPKTQEEVKAEISRLQTQLNSLKTQMKSFKVVVAPKEELKTHTELGYIGTTGNTNTSTFNLESKLERNWGKHEGALAFDGQYADDKGVESKNKFFVELEYDYAFTDRFAFGYLVGYKQDKFSAFDYQAYTGPGAKYKVIVSPKHNLSLEGNILYSVDEYSSVEYADTAKTTVIPYPNAANTPILATDPSFSNDYTAYRAKGVYTWQMFSNLKFNQELSYRGSFENANRYFVYSKSALTSKLSDIFSAGISYKVDYVNEAGDSKNTDTTLTANLIVDY
jgi:putative salt-induced outer membrane protein